MIAAKSFSGRSRQIKRFFQGRGGYWFWVAVFLIIVAGVSYGLFFATKKVDYIWRWNRVPQYFFFRDTIEVKAEAPGTVAAIDRHGRLATVTVAVAEGEMSYELPAADVTVEVGAKVFTGDNIGSRQELKAGLLMSGLWLTLKASVISILFGIIIGLFTGLARLSKNPALKWLAVTYVELIRGSPLLVQIFIWYFALGTMFNKLLELNGLPQLSSLFYGIVAMAAFAGAYVAEIVRAGIQSIHKGQTEAARSLGMSYAQAMRHVILPQAFRRILPPLAGQFISHIKDSSLLGVIAIRELSKATREAVTSSLQVFELYFICALLYLAVTFALSMLTQWIERRMIYD